MTVNNSIQAITDTARPARVAFIVSHPIQYYAPLHERMARRTDLAVKVFFTWHSGKQAELDRGFKREISWDLPLLDGYEHELVPNTSSDPGTHHFLGLRNPTLVARVLAWKPHIVHVTGWAWFSHLQALYHLKKAGIPVIFRGDSHLLDPTTHHWRALLKRVVLGRVYRWPSAFLYTGKANARYYKTFGVTNERLFYCPHSVDVSRFALNANESESAAAEWRLQLRLEPEDCVVLFAGKLERKKCPVQLITAVLKINLPHLKLLIVGDGELETEIAALAATSPQRILRLPFQNQSKMPIVYRMADIFVLPSLYQETWGLAVNEALACGRPVLVSDRVGCAEDVIESSCGFLFSWSQPDQLERLLKHFGENKKQLLDMQDAAKIRAWRFDLVETERHMMDCIGQVLRLSTASASQDGLKQRRRKERQR